MTLLELNLLHAMSIYAATMAECYNATDLAKEGIAHCQQVLNREIKLKTLDPVRGTHTEGTHGNPNPQKESNLGQSDSNNSNVMP